MTKTFAVTEDATDLLKRVLDVNAARQKAAATNLANCDTPGYQPKKVEFVKEMNQALSKVEMVRTNPNHLSVPRTTEAREGIVETVDDKATPEETRLEATMADLADAELAYSTAARVMSRRTATLRVAITGKP
ncbi:MAG TPA: flagellar basal body rod protein FlgB [bacterium]|nr:flagellar basal body rod protein FlgB [bacterium]